MHTGDEHRMTTQSDLAQSEEARDCSRRRFAQFLLMAGGAFALTGCASSGSRSTSLPTVAWPDRDMPRRPATTRRSWDREPMTPPTATPSFPSGVMSRTTWAGGNPIPSRMDHMQPVQRITVHHDGMPPVDIRSRSDAATRIELIRKGHLARGWGDIGYHYVVDPMGQVWEGRPLSWQGAHVKAQNEGNLGVLVMGNFEVQRPTSAQLAALDAFVGSQMSAYRLPVTRVFTHRELASTACPGRNLQAHMVASRARGGVLASA